MQYGMIAANTPMTRMRGMGKRRAGIAAGEQSHALFLGASKRRHLRLFLTKLLEDEANHFPLEGAEFDNACTVLRSWADLAEGGHLRQKETSHDADFLERIFGEALGYRSRTQTPDDYHREKS